MPKNHYDKIEDWHQAFIEEQHMFFVATAAPDGRVNMAPKDALSLRVMGPNRIVWVNLTGAENETGAHLAESSRMTLMWCAFGKKPMILRAYGNADLIHRRDRLWPDLIGLFPTRQGSRQIIDLTVDLVLKSCGFGVPLYDFVAHRDTLPFWEERQGEEGISQFWADRNQFSIDGRPTGLLDDGG
jgi:hypothetical protein